MKHAWTIVCSKAKFIYSGVLVLAMAPFLSSGCSKADPSFSLPSSEQRFSEAPSFDVVPTKIDILWVVDNSGSMESSQTALTSNFNRFIQNFTQKQYDFRMAVTTTDTFQALYNGEQTLRRYKDGANGNSSGVRVMDRNTPSLAQVFLTNATQGTLGSGDERAFQSLEQALTYGLNSDFRRADAFLAILIVSDEDDFSATTSTYLNNNYNDSRLIPVSTYKNFLDQFAGVGNYSVNAITILDTACRDLLNTSFTGRRVGQRYIQLSQLTGGVRASLCDNFGDSLQFISDTIVNQRPPNAVYQLQREPLVSSIRVKLNGVVVAQDATNGWTYDSSKLQVRLNGTAVTALQNGAVISIQYDPVAPTN